MGLNSKDRERCAAFLQSFIDEGRTLDEMRAINSFLFDAVFYREQELKNRRTGQLGKMPFKDVLAELPELDKPFKVLIRSL